VVYYFLGADMLNKLKKTKRKKVSKKVDRTQTKLSDIFKEQHFVRPNGLYFWEFLDKNGIKYKKKDFPFLSGYKKPRIKQVFDFNEYMKIGSKGEALSYLYSGFGKAFNYVGPVLDLEMKHGFNDHTDRHTLWVGQTGAELLQRAGVSYDGANQYDSDTEVLMILAGMTHDLGNFFSRKEHSTYSAWLLTKLFKNREGHEHEFETLLHSVLFHEEPVLVDLDLDLENGTPLQWALVVADKMHVGRDRIGGRSTRSGIEHGALEEDIHIVLNALIVRSAWFLGIRSFVWHLDFSIDQLEEKFSSFTTGDNKLHLPLSFRKVFRQRGVRYRDHFVELFNEVYGNRMKMAAKSAFLLFPHINEFRVELSDNDTRARVGSAKLSVFKIRRNQVL